MCIQGETSSFIFMRFSTQLLLTVITTYVILDCLQGKCKRFCVTLVSITNAAFWLSEIIQF